MPCVCLLSMSFNLCTIEIKVNNSKHHCCLFKRQTEGTNIALGCKIIHYYKNMAIQTFKPKRNLTALQHSAKINLCFPIFSLEMSQKDISRSPHGTFNNNKTLCIEPPLNKLKLLDFFCFPESKYRKVYKF